MIDSALVIEIHDLILSTEPGLAGDHGVGPIEGALARVENHIHYQDLDDVFEIAAMYAVAIARGHVFNDANKRTALVTALTYLALQGIELSREPFLEEIMVWVAEGVLDVEELALIFYSIAKNEGLID
ncbi:type II toxin-antitoxin system death-on-curing family toxin [Herbaspirillum huttiense]|uniref:type II toxin-antitoxin system death-on-curing family toxin n=1 Tax=Herbaspirillum huttiense TaxID=863372 RepID=UPI002176A9A9|nr:type II toxin-antitoxin system death-on-curing family toxin [Herbaspirillum huttiense]UWE18039.1 type II toxin-antitoxin system death-on-curing family toxin [Herbaspirillum huttiense]